jgi:hypothetical protein
LKFVDILIGTDHWLFHRLTEQDSLSEEAGRHQWL